MKWMEQTRYRCPFLPLYLDFDYASSEKLETGYFWLSDQSSASAMAVRRSFSVATETARSCMS